MDCLNVSVKDNHWLIVTGEFPVATQVDQGYTSAQWISPGFRSHEAFQRPRSTEDWTAAANGLGGATEIRVGKNKGSLRYAWPRKSPRILTERTYAWHRTLYEQQEKEDLIDERTLFHLALVSFWRNIGGLLPRWCVRPRWNHWAL